MGVLTSVVFTEDRPASPKFAIFKKEIAAVEEMNKRTKWLRFIVTGATEKTILVGVYTEELNYLGVVKWFGRWRCYAFFPSVDCVFEQQCMRDIARLQIYLMNARKKIKVKK